MDPTKRVGHTEPAPLSVLDTHHADNADKNGEADVIVPRDLQRGDPRPALAICRRVAHTQLTLLIVSGTPSRLPAAHDADTMLTVLTC